VQRAFSLSNFNTLVAIIAGLRSEWVNKSMRRLWNRVGIWEMRMFADLGKYVTSDNDFEYIRLATSSMAEAKPLSVSRNVIKGNVTDGQSSKVKTVETKVTRPSACIPFIGMAMSESRLLTVLDHQCCRRLSIPTSASQRHARFGRPDCTQ
jgi:Gdp/GTP exchange factor required for growth at low temperatures